MFYSESEYFGDDFLIFVIQNDLYFPGNGIKIVLITILNLIFDWACAFICLEWFYWFTKLPLHDIITSDWLNTKS